MEPAQAQMASEEEALSNSFINFAANLTASIKKGVGVFDGTVKAGTVDETKYICDITLKNGTGTVTLNAVPLRVLLNEKSSFIEIPDDTAGSESIVLICFRDGNINMPQILEVHKAKKIIQEIGGSRLEIIDGQIIFNNGTVGLPKADSLITRLNKIENDITMLKNAFTAWVVVPQDGGAALKAAAIGWASTPLNNTILNDIQNTKIKQ